MSTKVTRYIEASTDVKRMICGMYKSDMECRYCPFYNSNPFEGQDCTFDSINYSLRKMVDNGDIIDD